MSFIDSLIFVINAIAWLGVVVLVLYCVLFVIDIFMRQPELLRGLLKFVCFVVVVFMLAGIVFFVSNISCTGDALSWKNTQHDDLDAGTQ